MSMYSGKCDVADCYDDRSDEYLRKSDFYLGDCIVPLRINSQKDLAPFYPYLVSCASWSKERATVRMTEDSFIDREEREHLGWKLRDLQKYRRKCKRDKIPYVEEEALKKITLFEPTDIDREIARRVGKYGDKATIDGLHDSLHEYYRNSLFEKMVELGWDKKTADYWIWKDWNRIHEKYKE